MSLRGRRAVQEAARSAYAHRATTLVLGLVALAMTATTFLTAGRAAAAETEVLASVDDAGPRLISVNIAEPSPGVSREGLDRFAEIDGVDWVLGLGAARDIRSQATGQRINVAARDILTPMPSEVTIELGRHPRPGEAIVGAETQRRLHLIEPAGWLLDGGEQRAVVGRFSSSGAITDLDRLVLIQPADDAQPRSATLVYLLATDASLVDSIVRQVHALAGVIPAEALSVQTSPELIKLSAVLSGQVGALSRQLALGVIAVGIVLVALTMTLALNTRRRDFGRRRALGASRSALLAITLLEAAIAVVAGVVCGAVLGFVSVTLWIGTAPPLSFLAAATVLIALAGIFAAVPPAALAAWQDPLKILRVP